MKEIISPNDSSECISISGVPITFYEILIEPTTVSNDADIIKRTLTPQSITVTNNSYDKGINIKRRKIIQVLSILKSLK